MPNLEILVVCAEEWPHICRQEPPARPGPSRTRLQARCDTGGCRSPVEYETKRELANEEHGPEAQHLHRYRYADPCTDSGSARKVVLIAFPHERMKAVGLVTRSFVDEETGVELAAVYVPTAPNPAGGYLEIVPAAELVPLDWTVDEAMTFVLSGGTVAPERMRFSRPRSDADSNMSDASGARSGAGNVCVVPPNEGPASSRPVESGASGSSLGAVGHTEAPA